MGEATVGGVGLAAHESASLESADQVWEPGQFGVRERCEVAHPDRAIRVVRQAGQHVVLHQAQVGVVLQLDTEDCGQPRQQQVEGSQVGAPNV